jgi:hypothetical protein
MDDRSMKAAAGQSSNGTCGACRTAMKPAGSVRSLSAGLCDACFAALSADGSQEKCRQILQAIDAPILLMQPEPRQVFTANSRALALFGRELDGAEGHRGGEVFGCLHSYTRDGCGKDAHCSDCTIKAAIVSGFSGAASAVSTLTIRVGGGDTPYALAVSAEQAGGRALVRIDRFEVENGG